MNDKLRSILHTAWNEPRHFFFWLSMLSICGFIAAAGGAALTGPILFLAFVALGCILCFVVSIPAFILAWIPPVRRLFAWLLGRRFLVLGCLVTLVGLSTPSRTGVDGVPGRATSARGRPKASGLTGPASPRPRCRTTRTSSKRPCGPTCASSRQTTARSGATRIGEATSSLRVWPKVDHAPSPGSWIKAQPVDLKAWQAFYRGSNNVFAAQSGPPTNYFPVAKEPQTPAADVLLALSKFNENRQLLIAASARPQARFWINYDAGFAAMLPHLARLRARSQYLSLHANAALTTGDRRLRWRISSSRFG